MGVIGKDEKTGVTLQGSGSVHIQGAGSTLPLDITTTNSSVGIDGQGASTRLFDEGRQ